MERLPFNDTVDDGTPPTMPHMVEIPQGSGVLKGVIAGALVVGCLGGVCFILFGAKYTQKFSQKASPATAEATPRPAGFADPLHGLGGYDKLLTQKKPDEPVGPPAPTGKPDPQPTAPGGGQALAHRQEKPADRSPLVVQGKAGREKPTEPALPTVPRYVQGDAQELAAKPAGGAGAATVVERQQAFVERASKLQETQVNDVLHTPASPYMLLAGHILPATLETGIESDLPGHLKARIRQTIKDTVRGEVVLVPQGTVVMGVYNNDVVYGQNRVLVVWNRLILPNGQSIQLEGMPGVDLSGFAGLKDKVNNHLWPLFRAVFLSSVLSVGSRIPAGSTPQNYQQTLGQEFAQDFGSAANQAGQRIVQRELNRAPTITIRPGMSFNILVIKDLTLQPYTGLSARR